MSATTTNLTRRQILKLGAGGACSVTVGAGLLESLRNFIERETPADIFRGDAPRDDLWALWQQRGWAKEGRHYLKLGRNVQCKICPNNCILEPGDRSHCRNRINRNGTLYTLAYANPCSMHIDPVEKKPLYHFHPGSRSFSLATAGCVLRCLNCQNWEISQKKPEETKDARGPEFRLGPANANTFYGGDIARISLFPDDLAALAKTAGCLSISYTYSEPIAYYEYTEDSCKSARALGVKNILVTGGSIEEPPLRDLARNVDAAHVDLKGFDDAIYRKLNSGKLQTILNTITTLKKLGVWIEIINLIVPTYTDDLAAIRRMCDWLAANAGADTPLHFSRFHPQHKLTHLPPTPVETLLRARDIARAAGLRYVYVGNVAGVRDIATTFCPGCKQPVIERDIFAVTVNKLADGKCPACQTKIAGVWNDKT